MLTGCITSFRGQTECGTRNLEVPGSNRSVRPGTTGVPLLSSQRRQGLIGHFKVGVDVLHVVIVFEEVH